jgi:hypothetical protein
MASHISYAMLILGYIDAAVNIKQGGRGMNNSYS